MGATPHLDPTALRVGRTHPGAEKVATRLLDAADKVPSFCLEQEFTPEESEFRCPMGVGLGDQGTSSVKSRCWEGPGAGVPPSAPASPTAPCRGQLGLPEWWALAEKAVLEDASVEHQGRNSRSAISRGVSIAETRRPPRQRSPAGPLPGEPLRMLSPGIVPLLPAL